MKTYYRLPGSVPRMFSEHTLLKLVMLGLAGVLALPRQASCQPWDPAAEFSFTSSSPGVWRYGWKPSPTSTTFSQMTGTVSSGPIVYWSSSLGSWPFVAHSTVVAQDGGVTYSLPDEVVLHPGPGATGTLRFVAPQTRSYLFSFQFTSRHSHQWGLNKFVSVTMSGSTAYSAVLGHNGTTSGRQAISLAMNAGDAVDFSIKEIDTGHSPYFFGTSTGLKLLAGTPTTVSGTVNLADFQGDPGSHQVVLSILQDGHVVDEPTASLNPDGSFSIKTPARGTVSIRAKVSHWLRKADIGTRSLTDAGLSGLSFTLTNGDCDGDNEVGIGDYSVLSSAYGSSVGDGNWAENADLNGDETVDIGDYAILSANYGEVGD